MKRTQNAIRTTGCIILMMAVMAVTSHTVFAGDNGAGLPIPSSYKENETESVFESEMRATEMLPNPGSFLGDPGYCDADDYEYNGKTWEVWYYSLDSDWGQKITEWLKACSEAGYNWSPGSIEDQVSYDVKGNGYTAIVVPDYYDQIMLMKQIGLEMEPYEEIAADELQLGQVHICYNGRDYGVIDGVSMKYKDYKDESFFTDEYELDLPLSDMPIKNLNFYIYTSVRTGDSFHYSSDYMYKNTLLELDDTYLLFYEYSEPEYYKLKTEKDYCDIHIIYVDEEMIRGTVDGVFYDGKVELSFEFYLPINR